MAGLFRVSTVHPETGEDGFVDVEAKDIEDARRIVLDTGMLTGNIELLGIAADVPPVSAHPMHASGWPPGIIMVPMMISGVANVLMGLVWISTCIGAFWGVPMLFLALTEFSYCGKMSQVRTARELESYRTIGVFEIVAGLANLVGLICGIIVLVNYSSARKQLESIYPTQG